MQSRLGRVLKDQGDQAVSLDGGVDGVRLLGNGFDSGNGLVSRIPVSVLGVLFSQLGEVMNLIVVIVGIFDCVDDTLLQKPEKPGRLRGDDGG